jgi:hypothetical protein
LEKNSLGAKTSLLVFAERNAREALASAPTLDRVKTLQLARNLFPGEKLKPADDITLIDAYTPDNELAVGCFPGVSVVSAKEFGIDRPSTLLRRYIEACGRGTVTLHAMHSVVDWFAFACWTDGKLVRSLSLSPEFGIIE